MRRIPIVVVPLVLIGVLLYMALGQSSGPLPLAPDLEDQPGSPVDVRPTGEAERSQAPEVPAVIPAGITDEIGRSRLAAGGGGTTIKGRMLAAETSLPLSGVTVRLSGSARDRDDPYAAKTEWENPERITTGADGSFVWRFDPPASHRFYLSCSSEGRVGLRRRWNQITPGDEIDLGDLPMSFGTSLMGKILDQDGVPTAGLTLYLSSDGRGDGPPGFDLMLGGSTRPSAPDGSFDLREPAAPGSWTMSLSRGDYELIEPKRFVVPDGPGPVVLAVRVRNLSNEPTLSGIVVDEAGAPVRGLSLITTSFDEFHYDNEAQTGRDGTFLIRRRQGDDRPVRLRQSSTDAFVLEASTQEYSWGDHGIRLVAKRPRSVVLTVVEADTGRPVEEFSVRVVRPGSLDGSARMRADGHHEGGRAVLDNIRMGTHKIIVFPADQRFATSRFHEFEVGEQGADLRIELDRQQALTVRVVRSDGTPVADSEVQLIRKEGRGELRMDTISGSVAEAYDRFFSSAAMALILDRGKTDVDGTVTLEGPPAPEELALKAIGPDHIPVLEQGVRIGDDDVVVLRVAAGAILQGTVEPVEVLDFIGPTKHQRSQAAGDEAALERYLPSLVLADERGTQVYPPRRLPGNAVRADGSFNLHGIPPGAYELQIRFYQPRNRDGGGGNWRRQRLQDIALRAGETRELQLDLSFLEPGRISGRIFLDGEVYASSSFGLQRFDWADGRLRAGRTLGGLWTDVEGAFDEPMLPGSYRAVVTTVAGDRIVDEGLVEIRPGQSEQRVFRVVRRILRVRFVESDGTPAVERYIMNFREEFRPDGEGWIVLDPAPLNPVTFHTWPRGLSQQQAYDRAGPDEQVLARMRIRFEPVQMPAGERQAEITLRLPPDGL